MPEGPSIIIAREEMEQFSGKKVIAVSGSSEIDFSRVENKKIISFKSWGKHLLICFYGFTIRIHFLLFGSYLVNSEKASVPKLSLYFKDGELNFYACSLKILEGKIDEHYDWTEDLMSEDWDSKKAKAKLKEIPNAKICDALLEQDIFSGLGNIIKNEVLYRVKVHPESLVGSIPARKISEIINESQKYSFEFLRWKKNNELKKHWLAHSKKTCVRCDLPLDKKYTGGKKRRSFFCENCQILYNEK